MVKPDAGSFANLLKLIYCSLFASSQVLSRLFCPDEQIRKFAVRRFAIAVSAIVVIPQYHTTPRKSVLDDKAEHPDRIAYQGANLRTANQLPYLVYGFPQNIRSCGQMAVVFVEHCR
jgi:hypothetical protein